MVTFMDYDRISDTLMYLSKSFTLDFVVALSAKDLAGNRSFFHTESTYQSKYADQQISRSIKRRLRYYFVIANRQYFDGGMILRQGDVEVLKILMQQQVIPWFTNPDVYKIIDKKLVIGQYTPVDFIRSDGNYIRIVPSIFTYEDQSFKQGLRFYINSEDQYFDITIDAFYEFFSILQTDMYLAACSLINYVKTQPYQVNELKSKVGLAGAVPTDDSESWGELLKTAPNKQGGANNFFNKSKKKE